MKKLDRQEVQRLHESIGWSRRKMGPYRDNRNSHVRRMAGRNYCDQGGEARGMNFTALAQTIYVSKLAGGTMAAYVNTPHTRLRPDAHTLELAINYLMGQMGFFQTQRRLVQDALFGRAMCKIGMAASGTVTINGSSHVIGQPFCDAVDLDDQVVDMSARKYSDMDYEGDIYQVPLSEVLDSDFFQNKKNLTASSSRDGRDGTERASDISTGGTEDQGDNTFEPKIKLMDVFLRRRNMLVTLVVGDEGREPLRQVEWQGPSNGPYRSFGLGDLPGNILPLPPAAMWADIDSLANHLFKKLGDQAQDEKTVLGYSGSSAEDVARLLQTPDRHAVRMDRPEGIKEFNFSGVNQVTMAFVVWLRDLFSYFAGNLDVMGGLSSQAQTLGQERMMGANASELLEEMRDRTAEYFGGVIRDLAWHLYHDPFIRLPLVKRVPGTEYSVPVVFSPETRSGAFLDYNFSIKPFSLSRETPGAKLQAIGYFLTNYVFPLLPFMQERGIAINVEGLLRNVSRLSNIGEIEELLEFIEPSRSQQGPVSPTLAPDVPRQYEHINRSVGRGSERLMESILGASPGAGQAMTARH